MNFWQSTASLVFCIMLGLWFGQAEAEAGIIATTCAEHDGYVEGGRIHCYEADGSAEAVVW